MQHLKVYIHGTRVRHCAYLGIHVRIRKPIGLVAKPFGSVVLSHDGQQRLTRLCLTFQAWLKMSLNAKKPDIIMRHRNQPCEYSSRSVYCSTYVRHLILTAPIHLGKYLALVE